MAVRARKIEQTITLKIDREELIRLLREAMQAPEHADICFEGDWCSAPDYVTATWIETSEETEEQAA